ncbi:hypothetical protein MRB53_038161 [Persea americana]|nr:hypothetical protein MRB53_038161 [Persea americana]
MGSKPGDTGAELSVLEIIFTCGICQASCPPKSTRRARTQTVFAAGNSSGHGTVPRFWIGECSHLSCSRHLESGGELGRPVLFPSSAEMRVTRSSPLPSKRRAAKSGLPSVRERLSRWQSQTALRDPRLAAHRDMDDAIPGAYLRCPPTKLDAHGADMDAFRAVERDIGQMQRILTDLGVTVPERHYTFESGMEAKRREMKYLQIRSSHSVTCTSRVWIASTCFGPRLTSDPFIGRGFVSRSTGAQTLQNPGDSHSLHTSNSGERDEGRSEYSRNRNLCRADDDTQPRNARKDYLKGNGKALRLQSPSRITDMPPPPKPYPGQQESAQTNARGGKSIHRQPKGFDFRNSTAFREGASGTYDRVTLSSSSPGSNFTSSSKHDPALAARRMPPSGAVLRSCRYPNFVSTCGRFQSWSKNILVSSPSRTGVLSFFGEDHTRSFASTYLPSKANGQGSTVYGQQVHWQRPEKGSPHHLATTVLLRTSWYPADEISRVPIAAAVLPQSSGRTRLSLPPRHSSSVFACDDGMFQTHHHPFTLPTTWQKIAPAAEDKRSEVPLVNDPPHQRLHSFLLLSLPHLATSRHPPPIATPWRASSRQTRHRDRRLARHRGPPCARTWPAKGCSLIMNYTSRLLRRDHRRLAARLRAAHRIQCLPVQADMGSRWGPRTSSTPRSSTWPPTRPPTSYNSTSSSTTPAWAANPRSGPARPTSSPGSTTSTCAAPCSWCKPRCPTSPTTAAAAS